MMLDRCASMGWAKWRCLRRHIVGQDFGPLVSILEITSGRVVGLRMAPVAAPKTAGRWQVVRSLPVEYQLRRGLALPAPATQEEANEEDEEDSPPIARRRRRPSQYAQKTAPSLQERHSIRSRGSTIASLPGVRRAEENRLLPPEELSQTLADHESRTARVLTEQRPDGRQQESRIATINDNDNRTQYTSGRAVLAQPQVGNPKGIGTPPPRLIRVRKEVWGETRFYRDAEDKEIIKLIHKDDMAKVNGSEDVDEPAVEFSPKHTPTRKKRQPILFKTPTPKKKRKTFSSPGDEDILASLRPASQPFPKFYAPPRELRKMGLRGVAEQDRGKIDPYHDPRITNPMDKHQRIINRTDSRTVTPRIQPIADERMSADFTYPMEPVKWAEAAIHNRSPYKVPQTRKPSQESVQQDQTVTASYEPRSAIGYQDNRMPGHQPIRQDTTRSATYNLQTVLSHGQQDAGSSARSTSRNSMESISMSEASDHRTTGSRGRID